MAMAEMSRATRRGFSSSEINENALIIRGHALIEENTAGVGSMYLHVADGARLVLICLVVKRRRAGRREIHGRRVALQTEAIHVVASQQARIRRSVRKMAHGTTLSLDGGMFVNPWPDRIDVTLGADRILRRTQLQHLRLKSTMRVVAVSALDQPFVDPMMERLGKRRLNICMALVAEGGLARFEQRGLRFGLVDTVAVGAADKGIAMGGPLKIRMIANMASQASLSNLFRGCCCESKDLGRIPAAIDMGLAGSVAALACHALAAMLKCQLGMRISGEALHLVLMAGGAGLGADVIRPGSGDRSRALGCVDCLLVLSGSIHSPGFPEAGEDHNQRDTQQRASHPSFPMRGFLRLLVLKICLCP